MSTPTSARDLVVAMTRVVRDVDHRAPIDEVLLELTVGATRVFPEVDEAAVHVTHQDGQIDTLALTGPLARDLSDLQGRLREGPTYDAVTGEDTVVLHDVRAADRWSRYTAEATRLGLLAQTSIRLYGRTRTAGTPTFFSTRTPAFSEDTQAVAQVYAGHVGAVLSRAQADDAWMRAVDTRQVIGQATGMLMERHRVSADEAFSQLRKMSTTTNTKLNEVARRFIAADPRPRP